METLLICGWTLLVFIFAYWLGYDDGKFRGETDEWWRNRP